MTDQTIYSISQLTQAIKTLLERHFPLIWVIGEISNFTAHSSGHYYFTLKDASAQISAVMFHGQNRSLKFTPKDGMSVIGLGRITIWAPRGHYQIILEYLEPKGIGALQAAYEQLKARLGAEGLFDQQHKKPIPFLPQQISVITSPTGAVIRDILHVAGRRFPNMRIQVVPVRVQGAEAATEIIEAIELVNSRKETDVIILARGGGSLEELQAFNTEGVARAIFASNIPVISAVGHETDYTIADFVADLRAPTPSAAAELAIPLKADLLRRCAELSLMLSTRMSRYLEQRRTELHQIAKRLIDPKRKIQDMRLRVDDDASRLIRQIQRHISRQQERVRWRESQLNALSPIAILSRGYSITRTIPKGEVIRDAQSAAKGQAVEVMLAKGSLICRVEGRTTESPLTPSVDRSR